jgi:hypothetical protein
MESLSSNTGNPVLLGGKFSRVTFKNWQRRLQDYLNYRFKRFHPKRQRAGRK